VNRLYMRACVYVCVGEREREREREYLCEERVEPSITNNCFKGKLFSFAKFSIAVFSSPSCVRVCVCGCVCERVCVCMCVCEKERVRGRELTLEGKKFCSNQQYKTSRYIFRLCGSIHSFFTVILIFCWDPDLFVHLLIWGGYDS